ncbi:Transposase IS4 family (plasmid) [Azotobacter chroococcum NCIMB 8003]|uniref:Transposase IS4 family n=2 Tax=Azotobacter chroococcum TaxID=353 RepID=A0A0C4WT34_9GAMM|nr:Transposase, IS4 family [Azotobacter chroococcum NCIMB 8003]AJE21457.1 Transposase, IS4 family [Azotobacter chroococcum NCIMB 8003]AJE23478.1 Transposase, IS4 family [Azotobacter chroococcum NCIMB 8003]AJE23673.1 Transposase IS4 family [Azotobacter chroococcum NCIMB 8003]
MQPQLKPMRGLDLKQDELFSYTTLEQRIPSDHPLRPLRKLVDTVLASMDQDFDGLYSTRGRASIAPERLLRASLLQVIYTVRSERQLVEQIDFNLLFRWFVGLSMDEPVWDHSTFSQNRDRLFNQEVARLFFQRIKSLEQWPGYASDEHFSVDGTLIDAWASHKSFVRKDGGEPPKDGTRNPYADFKGEKRSNATHRSKTDPEARLARKNKGDASRLAHMAHTMIAHRSGLIVDVECTEFNGHAEVEAALAMLERTAKPGSTVGADKNYDQQAFVQGARKLKVTPHVAQKAKSSAIDGRTTRHEGYTTSLKIRKRIEEGFGWLKTVGGLRKTKLIGRAKLSAQLLLGFSVYNLIRLGSLSGWWRGSHV